MHVTAISVCLLTTMGGIARPPVEAPTPVLIPIRTLDNRLVGFAQGYFAIQRCAVVGDDVTLERLLKEGHDLNPPHPPSHAWSVLHYAVFQGTPRTVRLLVEHGADVDARIGDGPSPLEVARNRAQNDPTRKIIVKILQNHGAR